jgi:hypothetical protein
MAVSSTERWSTLCDVMHRLSPTARKVVTLIARDDLTRLADENSAESALRRDMFTMGGIDTSQPADVDNVLRRLWSKIPALNGPG